MLLELAFDLYNRVQKRIDSESHSKHWHLMQMAVVNNQACIYRDFAMGDATRECLEHLTMTVLHATDAADSEDTTRVFFFYNLQILGTDCAVAAAA